jgi:hypothetical protein
MVSCYADRVGRIIKGILDNGSALLLAEDQTLSQFYHNWTKTEDRMDLESKRKLLKEMVPEVGIEPTWGGSPAGF